MVYSMLLTTLALALSQTYHPAKIVGWMVGAAEGKTITVLDATK